MVDKKTKTPSLSAYWGGVHVTFLCCYCLIVLHDYIAYSMFYLPVIAVG